MVVGTKLFMVLNGFPNVSRVNSIVSGRNPPLYCPLRLSITMQGHQNKKRNTISLDVQYLSTKSSGVQ